MSKLAIEVLGDDGPPRPLPESGALVIGSSAKRAAIVLAGEGVADAHCAIGRLKDGGWALKDLGAPAGTTVNGKRVQSARLSHGDVVAVGPRKLRVLDPSRATELRKSDFGGGSRSGGALPERIGGFRVQKRLGRGSMGDVYLAVQESLNRPVALKVLSPKIDADHDFVQRFISEARAAAALSHPNVVVAYDVGEADAHHYLALEYMDRGSLEEKLRDGPLPWTDVLDVLHDAASGLVYAESLRIVHRDIKPANLMQNSVGVTKIADLGLATSIEADSVESGGKVFGTPHFISPEQARGETVDQRSDLYSLGATVYRLLTGHTPFEGETTRDILRGHFQDKPRPVQEHVPGVPGELAAIVATLLEKKPADRFQSAKELLERVDILRARAKTGAVGAGGSKRLLVLAALVVLALVGAAVAVLTTGGDDGGGEPRTAGNGPRVGDGPEGPPEIPTLPDPPDVGPENGGGAPASDPEKEVLRAKLAYRDLDRIEDLAERRDALRALVEEFPGVAVADEWLAEADELDREVRRLHAEQEARASARERLTQTLRASAGLDADPFRPAEALAALGAATAPPADPTSPEGATYDPAAGARLFEEVRAELEREALTRAIDEAGAALEAGDAAAARGDFETLGAQLETVVALTTLPAWDAERPAPDELEALAAVGETARARLPRVEEERATWLRERRAREREEIAARVRAGAGLEGELRALDVDAAVTRLDSIASELGSPTLRARLVALRDDLRDGRAVLRALTAEYDAGWRRKSVVDPRESRTTVVDVVAADDEGLTLSVGGVEQRVQWSQWGGSPEALHKLFNGRLTRNYTPAELRGISALTLSAACVAALAEADDVLRGEASGRFTEDEAARLLAPYEAAIEWAVAAGAEERASLEREAARALAKALRALSEGAPSVAVVQLETLLGEHADSLLALLLSDGTPWREPAPLKNASAAPRETQAAPAGGGDDR